MVTLLPDRVEKNELEVVSVLAVRVDTISFVVINVDTFVLVTAMVFPIRLDVWRVETDREEVVRVDASKVENKMVVVLIVLPIMEENARNDVDTIGTLSVEVVTTFD